MTRPLPFFFGSPPASLLIIRIFSEPTLPDKYSLHPMDAPNSW